MNSSYKPLIVALFLGVAGLGVGCIRAQSSSWESFGVTASSRALVDVAQGAEVDNGAILVEGAPVASVSNGADGDGAISLIPATDPETNFFSADAILQDVGQPIGSDIDMDVVDVPSSVYIVKKGDTLTTIAANFAVPASSIVNANPNLGKKSLKIGEKIIIPALSASDDAINSVTTSAASLPNFNTYFIAPAQGDNSGVLDDENAVEVTNSCGTPVVAAADGVVVPDQNTPDSVDGWNGGYGNFVLIEHAFGNDLYTRYTHLEKVLVSIGTYVKQGQEIGLTGESGGASSCQVGFEVIGAENPLLQ